MLAAYVALVAAGAGTAGRGLGRCAAGPPAPAGLWVSPGAGCAWSPRSWTLAPPAGGTNVQDLGTGVPPHPPPQRKPAKPGRPLAPRRRRERDPPARRRESESRMPPGRGAKVQDLRQLARSRRLGQAILPSSGQDSSIR